MVVFMGESSFTYESCIPDSSDRASVHSFPTCRAVGHVAADVDGADIYILDVPVPIVAACVSPGLSNV